MLKLDTYRVGERITMMIGVTLTYFIRGNDEDFCIILLLLPGNVEQQYYIISMISGQKCSHGSGTGWDI